MRLGNECAEFVETYLCVSFNAHNLNSYCDYFAASQKTFHIALDRLEFRVAGEEFGVFDFGQRGGEAVGVGHFVRGFVDGGLAGEQRGRRPRQRYLSAAWKSRGAFCSASSLWRPTRALCCSKSRPSSRRSTGACVSPLPPARAAFPPVQPPARPRRKQSAPSYPILSWPYQSSRSALRSSIIAFITPLPLSEPRRLRMNLVVTGLMRMPSGVDST